MKSGPRAPTTAGLTAHSRGRGATPCGLKSPVAHLYVDKCVSETSGSTSTSRSRPRTASGHRAEKHALIQVWPKVDFTGQLSESRQRPNCPNEPDAAFEKHAVKDMPNLVDSDRIEAPVSHSPRPLTPGLFSRAAHLLVETHIPEIAHSHITKDISLFVAEASCTRERPAGFALARRDSSGRPTVRIGRCCTNGHRRSTSCGWDRPSLHIHRNLRMFHMACAFQSGENPERLTMGVDEAHLFHVSTSKLQLIGHTTARVGLFAQSYWRSLAGRKPYT